MITQVLEHFFQPLTSLRLSEAVSISIWYEGCLIQDEYWKKNLKKKYTKLSIPHSRVHDLRDTNRDAKVWIS